MPVSITHVCGLAGRVDDVGEQDGGKHSVVGHVCLLAGEELGDLLEGIPPWLNEVVHVAPLQLNVFRARYAVCDVPPRRGQDEFVVGVLDDQGRHTDSWKYCART